jgi:hypothetical protein
MGCSIAPLVIVACCLVTVAFHSWARLAVGDKRVLCGHFMRVYFGMLFALPYIMLPVCGNVLLY